ncbi:MAG: hypothetical protein JSW60_05915 [Thermoplasmatales archaeon]|nr:MAG: hypothetical protein JSW60_05915 [Thermoplasmatales archaeon]
MANIYNNEGITGIAAAILLAGIILIAGAAASITMSNSKGETEKDYKQMMNEALDEISIYLQIKDVIGKYYSIEGEKRIQKIAILIKPLFSTNIDTSKLLIQLFNGKQIQMLYYSGNAEFIHSYPLFEHSLWNNQNENNFGLVVTLDKDKSLVDYSIINDHTDMAYITIKLSEDFQLKNGDSIQITLFPSTGVERTVSIEAPAPLTPIVSLH